MDFFNTILLSVICIMFPLLLYLIYLTYLNAKNENLKYEEVVFELALITGLFLTIELTKGVRTNYSIVLLNIPILFSYLRGKRGIDRKSTRLNSSHVAISYAVFCLKKKKKKKKKKQKPKHLNLI